GQAVLDYGCGPGWLAIELARRVGSRGIVHALDLNEIFLERAAGHAAAEGMKDRIRFHHAADDRIPLPDGSVDCAIAKNVLEYAPIVVNMAGYARESGRMDDARIDRLLAELQAAITDGSYLLVLPQFLVTGTV